MQLTAKFSSQLSLVRRRLTDISEEAQRGLEEETKQIAIETAEQLRVTTPGVDLPRGWKAVPLPTTRAAARWAVLNTDPRANAPVPRSSTGRTLLNVLEYGTMPHKIEAKNAPMLAFFWEKLGINVRFRKVQHPGTRPYHFLRPAIATAKAKQAAASRRLARRLGRPVR